MKPMFVPSTGKACFVLLATMILFVMSTLGKSQRRMKISSVKFFDKYDGEVSLAYFDGYVNVTCENTRCDADKSVQLLYPNKSVAATTECKFEDVLRLPISAMPFGEYTCESDGVKYENSLKFNYRLCSDEECASSSCDEKKFCVVDPTSAKGCALTSAHCSDTHDKSGDRLRFCAGNRASLSLCEAIAADYSKTWVKQNDCPFEEKDEYLHVRYQNSKGRSYNEPIELDVARSNIEIYCPDHTNMRKLNLICVFKGSDGTVVHNIDKSPIGTVAEPDVTSLFSHGSRVTKMECDLGGQYHLSNYLIFIGGKAEVKSNVTNGFTDSLECKVDPNPDPEFKVTYTWTTPDGKKEGQTLTVYKDGGYTCHAQIKYKKCTPFVKIEAKEFSSGVYQAKADPKSKRTASEKWTGSGSPPSPTGQSTEGAKGLTTDPGVSMGAIIGGAVAVVLVVVVIAVVVIMMLRRQAKQNEAEFKKQVDKLAAEIRELRAAGLTQAEFDEQLEAKLGSVHSKVRKAVKRLMGFQQLNIAGRIEDAEKRAEERAAARAREQHPGPGTAASSRAQSVKVQSERGQSVKAQSKRQPAEKKIDKARRTVRL